MLYRLNHAGFEAYLVGGGVRDLLLGGQPKDFDIATSAKPEEIKALFRNCRLIGRRFRLAHVRFGREVIEVATFRAHHDADESGADGVIENGLILRDNVYGTRDEDAMRRDFSVNCLYYDVRDFSVIDFAEGMADLEARLIRMIGEPTLRYREDPVRILRAARFAAKLDFTLEQETAAAVELCPGALHDIPPARLFEEVLKLFMTGHASASLTVLRQLDVFKYLFPATDRLIGEHERAAALVEGALRSTDERIAQDKTVTPAFLVAAFLWPVLRVYLGGHEVRDMSTAMAIDHAGSMVIADQIQRVALPKRFTLVAKEIWGLQPALEERRGRRPLKLLNHPRLRAAYDFLLLRAQAGEPVQEHADWWTKFVQSDDSDRQGAVAAAPKHRQRKRRRKKPSAGERANTGTGP